MFIAQGDENIRFAPKGDKVRPARKGAPDTPAIDLC
jgi:hypothetical protein